MPRLSEDGLIAAFFTPLAGLAGLGLRDDAACLTPPPGSDLVLTKDMLIAGVHFFADDPAEAIARKALRVNLSDLAAKAAEPLGFLLGLALPADWQEDWLAAFAAGLGDDAAAFGLPLLGGDTVKTSGPLSISVTALGHVPSGAMVPRTASRAGDVIYVSGTIGDAALGLEVRRGAVRVDGLDEGARAFLLDRYLLPQPRLALRAALRAHAHAAMDVSDGLVGDLGKMLRSAGLTAEIEVARVPMSPAGQAAVAGVPSLHAACLAGGDDYEILAAVAPAEAAAFEATAVATGIAVAAIGVARTGDAAPRFFGAQGKPVSFETASFQHFT